MSATKSLDLKSEKPIELIRAIAKFNTWSLSFKRSLRHGVTNRLNFLKFVSEQNFEPVIPLTDYRIIGPKMLEVVNN